MVQEVADLAEDPRPAWAARPIITASAPVCSSTSRAISGESTSPFAVTECSRPASPRVWCRTPRRRRNRTRACARGPTRPRSRHPRRGARCARVAVCAVPAGAYFQRHGHVDRGDPRFRRLRPPVIRSAAAPSRPRRCRPSSPDTHVDVDDLRAPVDVVAGGVSHLRGIGTGDLDDYGLDLALVVRALQRLARVAELRIGGNHLRNGETGAEPLAQLAERTVGHASHRRDNEIAQNAMRADLHCVSLWGICYEGSELYRVCDAVVSAFVGSIFFRCSCCKRASPASVRRSIRVQSGCRSALDNALSAIRRVSRA